jgi:hypothetical protein
MKMRVWVYHLNDPQDKSSLGPLFFIINNFQNSYLRILSKKALSGGAMFAGIFSPQALPSIT